MDVCSMLSNLKAMQKLQIEQWDFGLENGLIGDRKDIFL